MWVQQYSTVYVRFLSRGILGFVLRPGDGYGCRGARVRRDWSSVRTWVMTVGQSWKLGWRKRRMVGYQGESGRWVSHMWPRKWARRVQVGLASAPARWTMQ